MSAGLIDHFLSIHEKFERESRERAESSGLGFDPMKADEVHMAPQFVKSIADEAQGLGYVLPRNITIRIIPNDSVPAGKAIFFVDGEPFPVDLEYGGEDD